jgi:hypothetical protein
LKSACTMGSTTTVRDDIACCVSDCKTP